MAQRVMMLVFLLCAGAPSQEHPGVIGAVFGSDGRDVVVRCVLDGSPARKAGLRVGDRVMKFGDELVRRPVELRTKLYWLPVGEQATLTVARGKTTHRLTVEASDWKTVSKLARWKGAPFKTGQKAPGWWAERWDLPAGMKTPPTPASTRGKVVCLFVYQAL